MASAVFLCGPASRVQWFMGGADTGVERAEQREATPPPSPLRASPPDATGASLSSDFARVAGDIPLLTAAMSSSADLWPVWPTVMEY